MVRTKQTQFEQKDTRTTNVMNVLHERLCFKRHQHIGARMQEVFAII